MAIMVSTRLWLGGAISERRDKKLIEALVATTDGFELAEVDLDLRGEGTLIHHLDATVTPARPADDLDGVPQRLAKYF